MRGWIVFANFIYLVLGPQDLEHAVLNNCIKTVQVVIIVKLLSSDGCDPFSIIGEGIFSFL